MQKIKDGHTYNMTITHEPILETNESQPNLPAT